MIYIIIILILIIISYSILITYFYKVLIFLKRLKRDKSKIIYLTFDDGPNEVYTEKLLNLLQKYNIKVSFFLVAKFANENKNLVKRMRSEGHAIGLHSLEHKNALISSKKYTEYDFKQSIKIMRNMNIDIKYFRPPWGHMNINTLLLIKKYNLKLILWNVMAGDWKKNITSIKIQNILLKKIKSGDIVCLHDNRGKNNAPLRTIKALDSVIPILLEQGYIFKTVGEYEK